MRVSLRAVVAVATLVVAALYVGSNGLLPGTPASEWKHQISALEAKLALHRSVVREHPKREEPALTAQAHNSQDEQVQGAAKCGTPTVVIGILTAANDRSKMLRQVLRETWFKLADPHRVTIRFLLSAKPATIINSDLLAEAHAHQDLLFLPVDPGHRKGYSGGKPSNLLERVQAFMRWVGRSCGNFRYVLKSDDDSYVAVDRLLRRVDSNDFPTSRLYMGRFLGGMPGRNSAGKPDADNYQNMHEFPKYAGAGYLVTPDVAAFLGQPGLPMLFHRVEDRGIGVMLNGFNITYLDGHNEFQPWGACFENSLWIHHFQKDPELMRRRYRRAAGGKSICGEGFPHDVVCGMAEQGKGLELKCPKGKTINEVLFASYGRHKTSAPGPCAEGMDALTTDPTCHHPGSRELVEKACKGKSKCVSLVNTVKDLGVDPCPSEHWDKRFLAVVRCS